MRSPFAVAVLLCSAAVTAAPVPKEIKKKDDKSQLMGTWKCVAENGQLGEKIHTHTFTFDADGGLRMLYGKNNAESVWTYTIDETQSPKRMGWAEKPPSRTTFDCVYELDGDTLKVALVSRGQPVPEKLERGKSGYLYELTRDTSK